MKGRELEAEVLYRARTMEAKGLLTMGRYGVNAVMMKNPATGKAEWQVIPSLPDLEGIVAGLGRQFIIECKVCSQASYTIAKSDKKNPKQIDHMMLRSRFGAKTYLLIHFVGYKLVKISHPDETYAIPVYEKSPLWMEYYSGQRRSISRRDAEMYGISVPWNTYSKLAKKLTPDLSFLLPDAQQEPFTLS